MKLKLIFLSAFILSLSLGSLHADKGTTSSGGLQISQYSVIGTFPSLSSVVNISQDWSGITAKFTSNLGLVEIVIQNGRGNTIYSETIDTNFDNQSHISTFGFAEGYYVVSIKDKNNILKQQVIEIK